MNKQDIAFFTSKEAKRIRELWEPRMGDWVYSVVAGHIGLVLVAHNSTIRVYFHTPAELGFSEGVKDSLIFLPRQGQLQAMLEERGYFESHAVKSGDEKYIIVIHNNLGDSEVATGPTPSIALGKCLLEVLEEEGR